MMRKPRTEQEKRRDEWQDAEAVWLAALSALAASPDDKAALNREAEARDILCAAEGAYYAEKVATKRDAVLAKAAAAREAV